MAKPIVFIKVSKEMPHDDFRQININLTKELNDYHVLFALSNVSEPEIQVFYEKDFNEVKYEELKAIIENELKK